MKTTQITATTYETIDSEGSTTHVTRVGTPPRRTLTRKEKQMNIEVYSGKPGCMCGCKGKYSGSPSMISRVRNIMTKHFSEVAFQGGLSGESIAYVEVNGRAYAAYVKP